MTARLICRHLKNVERDTGVGPASLAWEANALPMC